MWLYAYLCMHRAVQCNNNVMIIWEIKSHALSVVQCLSEAFDLCYLSPRHQSDLIHEFCWHSCIFSCYCWKALCTCKCMWTFFPHLFLSHSPTHSYFLIIWITSLHCCSPVAPQRPSSSAQRHWRVKQMNLDLWPILPSHRGMSVICQ